MRKLTACELAAVIADQVNTNSEIAEFSEELNSLPSGGLVRASSTTLRLVLRELAAAKQVSAILASEVLRYRSYDNAPTSCGVVSTVGQEAHHV